MYGSSNEFNFSPEDNDVWQPSSGLVSGDFYREPDNVCRGVTISAGDLPVDSFGFKGDFVDSDFYSQPDDVCKGITLTGSAYDGYSDMDKFFHNPGKTGFDSKEDLFSACFSEGDKPPAAPTDSLFKFELTTIYATLKNDQLPCEIGNAVLDFFRKHSSVLTKPVRYHKYAIKLDVFAGSAMFSMKARVYAQSQQYAIEFQRRAGDTVTFNRLFKEAKDFFSERFSIVPQHSEAPSLPAAFLPPPIPAEFLDPNENEDGSIAPLYDLCSMPVPALQAEAAESLHNLAKEGVVGIYTSQTFRSIYELLQSSSTEVLLPTSCLLSLMAKAPEASALFVSEGMLTKLVEEASNAYICSEIQVILSQAFLDAVRIQTALTLSGFAARTLVGKVQSVTQMAPLGTNQKVLQNLQEAMMSLGTLQGV